MFAATGSRHFPPRKTLKITTHDITNTLTSSSKPDFTLNQLLEKLLEDFLAPTCLIIGIVIIQSLFNAADDLKLMRRHPKAAAAVNEERSIYRNDRLDVEIAEVYRRII